MGIVKRGDLILSISSSNRICFKVKVDDLVKSQNWDGKVKSSSFKARKFRVIRRTYSTLQ